MPFSFVSGSIRELLIHVPWTKITSEPITITINTIGEYPYNEEITFLKMIEMKFSECILNLKGKDSGSTRSDHSPQAREKNKKGTSHGYLKFSKCHSPKHIRFLQERFGTTTGLCTITYQ